MSTPVVVNVGDTANFTCNEACNGNLLWTFHTHNENLEVLECVKETCTKNENFKNRMILKPGALSLALYPVLYNDEGLYTAKCDSVIFCSFHLKTLGKFLYFLVKAKVLVLLLCSSSYQNQSEIF